MARTWTVPALLSLPLLLLAAGCGSNPFSGGDPNGNLDVEFRNFSTQVASMALAGETPIDVPGNLTDGTPRIYRVVNPGSGSSLAFTADWNGTMLSVTCTVTDATAVSVPPSVVIQPIGVLDCTDW